MNSLPTTWHPIWVVVAIAGGVAAMIGIEFLDDPDMTSTDILFEAVKSTLIVLTISGVLYLLSRTNRQHKEQLALIRDIEVARAEGTQWRTDMRELLKGLSAAIDSQFDRWQLTAAEREVALLLLKGLSHREIAALRDTSERTIRQQSQAIYAKSNLSGRAALSAFFLEDLLLPRTQK